jgi:hypothetical protein
MPHTSEESWHELWGTFSVRDHCRRGAFISEVLFYDQLVLPVVPTADDLYAEAQAKGEKVDAAKLAKDEWERWKDAGWDPSRQTLLAAILKNKKRVELIPWTFDRQNEWQAKMKTAFADARRDGYFMTGSVLGRFAPRMARSVVAVSQYHSLGELRAGERIRRLEPHEPLPASTLLAVLGHELLMPADPEEDNFRHLEEALDVSSDPKYQACRRSLYEWQQKFISGDYTDAPSIKAAVENMTQLVHELKTATQQQKRWSWIKRFFTFMNVGSAFAALGGPLTASIGAGGTAVASVGTFVVDELAPKPGSSSGLPAATLVLNAQSELGID